MAEYLPDTDDVRESYSDPARSYGMDREKADQFDRWLRDHDAKVLEDAAEVYRSGQLTGVFYGRDGYTQEWLRARAASIRGEG